MNEGLLIQIDTVDYNLLAGLCVFCYYKFFFCLVDNIQMFTHPSGFSHLLNKFIYMVRFNAREYFWVSDVKKVFLGEASAKKVFIEICGIFKILIWLPLLIESFMWAAKCPKPLLIHWKVIESGVFFMLVFLGCPKLGDFSKFSKYSFFVALLISG